MLPDKVYKRYYNIDCDICSDGEVNLANDDGTQCGDCNSRFMCQDCADDKKCSVCDEKWKDEDNNELDVEVAMCDSCEEGCDECGIAFHRKCKAEHAKSCNRVGRAKRALVTAEETIEYRTDDLKRAKRRVASLEKEILAAKRTKVEAEEELKNLKSEE